MQSMKTLLLRALAYVLVGVTAGVLAGLALPRVSNAHPSLPPAAEPQGRVSLSYADGDSQASTATAGGAAFEASWKHDPDRDDGPPPSNGPLQPVTITVKYEQKSGESIRSASEAFRTLLSVSLETTPPNVPQ